MQQKYWSTGNDSFMLQTILFPEIFLFIYVFIYLENMTIPTWEGLPMMKQPYIKFAEEYRSESLSVAIQAVIFFITCGAYSKAKWRTWCKVVSF